MVLGEVDEIMRVNIRNMPDDIVKVLDERAREKGKSREGYLREQLILLAECPDILDALEENSRILKLVNEIFGSDTMAPRPPAPKKVKKLFSIGSELSATIERYAREHDLLQSKIVMDALTLYLREEAHGDQDHGA
jgi:plasmid stability protein